MSSYRTRIIPTIVIALASMIDAGTAFAFEGLHTTTGAPMRWKGSSIAMEVDESLGSLVGGREAIQAAIMASEAWRGLPGVPDVHILDGTDSDGSVASSANLIRVVSPWPHDPEHIAITAHNMGWHGQILGAEILVNGDLDFGLLAESDGEYRGQHDIASVLTHEIGHVLGLGHSDVEGATMFPDTELGTTIARTLEEDDEAGAIDIYGQGFPELKSAFECSIGRGPGTGRDAGALVALLLLGVALSRRRARRVLGLATALVIVGLAIQSCVLANSSASMHVGASVAGPCELDVPPQVTFAGGPHGRDAASQLTLRSSCRGAEQILSIDHAPAANDVRRHHAPSSVEAISEPVVVTVLL